MPTHSMATWVSGSFVVGRWFRDYPVVEAVGTFLRIILFRSRWRWFTQLIYA